MTKKKQVEKKIIVRKTSTSYVSEQWEFLDLGNGFEGFVIISTLIDEVGDNESETNQQAL